MVGVVGGCAAVDGCDGADARGLEDDGGVGAVLLVGAGNSGSRGNARGGIAAREGDGGGEAHEPAVEGVVERVDVDRNPALRVGNDVVVRRVWSWRAYGRSGGSGTGAPDANGLQGERVGVPQGVACAYEDLGDEASCDGCRIGCACGLVEEAVGHLRAGVCGVVLGAEATQAEVAEEPVKRAAVGCLGFVGEAGAGVDVGEDAEVADVGEPRVVEDGWADETAETEAAQAADPVAELDAVRLELQFDEEAVVDGCISCAYSQA